MDALESELFQFPRGVVKDTIDALAWQICEGFQVPDWAKEPEEERAFNRPKFSFKQIIDSMHTNRVNLPFPTMLGHQDHKRWDREFRG